MQLKIWAISLGVSCSRPHLGLTHVQSRGVKNNRTMGKSEQCCFLLLILLRRGKATLRELLCWKRCHGNSEHIGSHPKPLGLPQQFSLSGFGDRYRWTFTGPHDGNEWRKCRVIPRAHPLRPCVFAKVEKRGGSKWALDFQRGDVGSLPFRTKKLSLSTGCPSGQGF